MTEARQRRIPYSDADARWLKANLTEIVRTLHEYQRALSIYFGHGDIADPEHKISGRTGAGKGHWIHYTDDQLAFIKHRRRLPRRQLHAAFTEAYPDHGARHDDLKALCSRKGWKTGRTGCFAKGTVPPNKGKKMPFNANSARTQFKKGQLPHNTKFAGHERLTNDGYVEISVNETNPHTGFERRYVPKHRWEWEKLNGPVPEGFCLKSLDGNKANTDPANWVLVPRGMLPRLNGKSGRNYDGAPDELKPTIMAIAKLEHQIHERAQQ